MGSLAVLRGVDPRPFRPRRFQNPSSSRPFRVHLAYAGASRRIIRCVNLSFSASASHTAPLPAGPDYLERCFSLPTDVGGVPVTMAAAASPQMKGKYGSFRSLTLEKAKLNELQKKKLNPETATGGGGGDIGKKIGHGGGDGGDDDDDYFDDFDDDDEGDEHGLFRKRLVVEELFDRKFVDAVLEEWFRTIKELPAGLRLAYEMGLVSSAQMVRHLSIIGRPSLSRLISRALPASLSRAFIGRMVADPSFLYKMILETVLTLGSSIWWELKNRKKRITQEWDMALVNVLTATACNVFVVWSLAPCRSYGNTFRFNLQNTIQKLPNNVFEKSYPMREFDLVKRIPSFFYQAGQLSLVGMIAGSVQGALLNSLSTRKETVSVTVPSVRNNALGYGAFLGLYANLRYQMLYGLDRAMIGYFDVMGVAVLFSTLLRATNAYVGEISRLAWLGVEENPSGSLSHAHDGSSDSLDGHRWLASKNAVNSRLALLGIHHGSEGAGVTTAKPRRKRTVKKKVSVSSV